MPEALKRALGELPGGHALPRGLLEGAFAEILSGEASAPMMAAFLTGLAVRGETASELVAGATIMRQHARRHDLGSPLLDTCGTGGLPWKSLNTSTASALVIAAAGGRVAKHGNRSVPPKTGSADVLEALGVNLDVDDETLRRCVDSAGVGFMFARTHHSAMRHVAPVRAELGLRTIFNLLGPLTNPAGADHQILGVSDVKWLEPMANALAQLGTRRAWVVHGMDGIDEVSISGPTRVAAVEDGAVRVFEIAPADAGLTPSPLSSLEGEDVAGNARAILELLDGQAGPFRNVVCLNAACGLHILGLAGTLAEGVSRAGAVLDSGAARGTLKALCALSHGQDA
ncbi:MAG: anthranilate phosphoribosyltransferase [Pseudomonadota bacterium]